MRKKRKRRPVFRATKLTKSQILDGADDWYARRGSWPHQYSGLIPGALGEQWRRVDYSLRYGLRGLPGKSSLAQLLAERRGVRNLHDLPRLTISKILAWADEHFRRSGEWPAIESGAIIGTKGETWAGINASLRNGGRGLPGGGSLAELLARKRGVRNRSALADLSIRDILAWADAHFHRHGSWPTKKSGAVADSNGETWVAIEVALNKGNRGLPGGSSPAGFLAEHRGKRNRKALPRIALDDILAWADDHCRRYGIWPTRKSTAMIPGPAGDTWLDIDEAVRRGTRGLPGGFSLARLLAKERGVRNRKALPKLRIEQLLAWAEEHVRRTARWPSADCGEIRGSGGETWMAIESALRNGQRGLPGGSSLSRLLQEHARRVTASPR
jgi:hypothetical protein